jgi:hypothetical protein
MLGVYILYRLGVRAIRGSPDAVVAHIPTGEQGRRIKLVRKELDRVALEPHSERDWALVLPSTRDRTIRLYGEDALRGLGLVLPPTNRYGGNRAMVQQAVGFIERTGDPMRFVQNVATRRSLAGALTEMPATVRLALEMSTHEEQERRALEGELAELERAWHEAEEIAGISDSLLLPGTIGDRLRSLRG